MSESPLPSRATPSAKPASGVFSLRLLATTDIHAHVLPYDYTWDQPLASVGLARTASLIRAARKEVHNSILLDNGDFLQGNPLGELAATHRHTREFTLHPVIAAMNLLGYDAGTLGNHEFSFGLPFLQSSIAKASFPIVSANLLTQKGNSPDVDQHLVPPTALLRRTLMSDQGGRAEIGIGIIGFLPPQVEIWESKHLNGRVTTRDIFEAADVWVPRLRAKGADIVVALCHSGFGDRHTHDQMENAAVPLASIDGIDAVIAGHTHLPFPGPEAGIWPDVDNRKGTVSGKPVVMAGFWGSHLGIIDLDLDFGPDGWAVKGSASTIRPISRRDSTGKLRALVRSDPAVSRSVRAAHRATLDFIRNPIGRSAAPMHTYFARIADCAALKLVQAAQRDWAADALAGTDYDGLPILSAASPFKSGGRGGPEHFTDIPAGEIALRHISDLYVFPNSIRALFIDGALLRNWLERSAAQFLQLTPGRVDQPLLDPSAPSYNFDSIDGVSYEIDVEAPPRFSPHGDLLDPKATRILNLCLAGKPVEDADKFVIVTNNFRASGGGGFAGIGESLVINAPSTLNSGVIRDHVARLGLVMPPAHRNWRIVAPTPGTGGWFDTGPKARQYLSETRDLTLRAIRATCEGFLRCELRLQKPDS
jgi:2',3'-cyclic-nucleotide 2'-phosphodiesterase / 3'-nucleotidase